MRVLSYLIAGVALYGGLGWLADHLLHRVLLPLGIVLGAGLRGLHHDQAVRAGRRPDAEPAEDARLKGSRHGDVWRGAR